MKSLLRKELRELLPWALLSGLAIVAISVWTYIDHISLDTIDQFFTNELAPILWLASMAQAVIFGLLQSMPDRSRDRQAFLMHRAVTRSQVFSSKTIAASLYYFATFVTAIGIPAWMCHSAGVERYPFEWAMIGHIAFLVIVSFAFYFIAATIYERRRGFIGILSALMPVSIPIAAIALFSDTVTRGEAVKIPIFAGAVFAVILTATVAKNVFQHRSDTAEFSKFGFSLFSLSTLVSVTSGWIFALISVLVFSISVMQPRGNVPADSATRWLTVFKNGDVCEMTVTGNHGQMTIQETRNLKREGEGLPEVLEDLKQPTTLTRYHETVVSAAMPTVDLDHRRPYGDFGNRILRQVHSQFSRPTQPYSSGFDNLFYSQSRGVFLGYKKRSKTSQPGSRESRKEHLEDSITRISRNGFDAEHVDPFGDYLFEEVILAEEQNLGAAELSEKELDEARQIKPLVIFSNGIFEIDFDGRKVNTLYEAPEGESIRAIGALGRNVLIRYGDHVSVYRGEPAVRPSPLPSGSAIVWLPGPLVKVVPVPKTIRNSTFNAFSWDDKTETAWFYQNYGLTSFGQTFIHEVDTRTGRNRSFSTFTIPRDSMPTTRATSAFASIAGVVVPSGVTLFAGSGETLMAWLSGHRNGLAVQIARASTLLTCWFLATTFFMSLLCAWIAGKCGTLCGRTRLSRFWWMLFGFLLGPIGILTLVMIFRRPDRTPCPSCSRKRSVENETCEHCNQTFPRPQLNGTELITGRKTGVPAVA